jgi:FSR family fosmidomycin resistance protein-like MFS transporter
MIIAAVILVGSLIFHPEASRISFLVSGGKRGLAQSIFQLRECWTVSLVMALYSSANMTILYCIWFAIVALIDC